MGNAESHGPFAEGPASKLAEYGFTTVSAMLKKYTELDMEFGLNDTSLTELFEASGIACSGDDADLVPAIMSCFPNENLNALDFMNAFSILSKGGASSKVTFAYDTVNFRKDEDITYDELIILLLCIARGIACLSGVSTSYDPKSMSAESIQEVEKSTLAMIINDFDLGDDANLAAETVSKQKFEAWFEKIQ